MIERSQVRVPTAAMGEFSDPGSSFSADSFRYPFRHHRVTKSTGDRLQLHAPHVFSFEENDCNMVHGCMMYTERAARRQQFHVAPAM